MAQNRVDILPFPTLADGGNEGLKKFLSFKTPAASEPDPYAGLLGLDSVKSYIQGDNNKKGVGNPQERVGDVQEDFHDRNAFLVLMNGIAINSKSASPVGQKIKLDVFLEEFGSKDGKNKFLAALREEVNSQAFREAYIRNAFKSYKGDPGNGFHVILIGGASGVGKTFSAETYVKDTFKSSSEPQKQFLLPIIDGGIPRDISVIKKILIAVAESKGYIIDDLNDVTEDVLSSDIKKGLQNLVFNKMTQSELQRANIAGMECVETCSSSGNVEKLTKDIEKIKKKLSTDKPIKIHHVMVRGEDPSSHAKDVNQMGEYRAFPSTAEVEKRKNTFRATAFKDNAKAHDIPTKEYKNYKKEYYVMGLLGSWKAGAYLRKWARENGVEFTLSQINNTVKLYTENGDPYENDGDPIIANTKVAKKAKELMLRTPGLLFKDALNRVKKIKLESGEDNPDYVDPTTFIVRIDLNLNKGPFGVLIDYLFEKIDINQAKSAFRAFKSYKIDKAYATKLIDKNWPEKNIPYILEAIKIGQEVDYSDLTSLNNARQKLGKLIEKMDEKYSSLKDKNSPKRKTREMIFEVFLEVNERILELEKQKKLQEPDIVIPVGFKQEAISSEVPREVGPQLAVAVETINPAQSIQITKDKEVTIINDHRHTLKIKYQHTEQRSMLSVTADGANGERPDPALMLSIIETSLLNWKPGDFFRISARTPNEARYMLFAAEATLKQFKIHDPKKYNNFDLRIIRILSNNDMARGIHIDDLSGETRPNFPIQGKDYYKKLLENSSQSEHKLLKKFAQECRKDLGDQGLFGTKEKDKLMMEILKKRREVMALFKKNPQLEKEFTDNPSQFFNKT